MPFITQGKSNIEYLLIVALVATVAGGIIYWQYSLIQDQDFVIQEEIIKKVAPEEKNQKAEIVRCTDDYLKNNNALDYIYEIFDDQVDVTGSFKEGNIYYGQKTISMEAGDEFFLPTPLNKNFSMKLEKIEKDGAHFLFNNPEAPSCQFFVERIAPKLSESFSYPYPLSWEEDGISFSLTGISLGEISAPGNLTKTLGNYYQVGEKIYALVLGLKIKALESYNYTCVSLNFRRALNEEGDTAIPNNDQFRFPGTGGCQATRGVTFNDQKVIFVVPETEKVFTLTTGGKSNIFFTVTVLDDGHLKLEKTYTGNQG